MNESYDLVLDASQPSLHILVLKNGALFMEGTWFLDHRATEVLAGAIACFAAMLGIAPAAFRRIACVNGPGSFTGIRLVLATAAGLKRSGPALLGAIDGLHAMALTASRTVHLPTRSTIHVVTHARKNLLHYAAFGHDSEPLGAAVLLSPAEAARLVGPTDLVCGSGIGRNPDSFLPLSQQGVILLPGLTEPTSEAYAELALRARYGREDLAPLYIRPCDAVDNLERLSVRQGIDPEEARRRFSELLTARPVSDL